MQVGPHIPVGTQRYKAAVGPNYWANVASFSPTWFSKRRSACSEIPDDAASEMIATSFRPPLNASRSRTNENCAGSAQIAGQLQGSNRDFQSKCWAKSRNLGQQCTLFVTARAANAPKGGLYARAFSGKITPKHLLN